MENASTSNISPEVKQAQEGALVIAKNLATIAVTDQASLSIANDWSVNLRAVEKKIDGYWDPLIDNAKEAKKKAEESRKGLANEKERMKDPVTKARKLVESKIAEYVRVEEEKRRVETEKRRQEATRQEEDMRVDMAVEAADAGNLELADSLLQGAEHVPATAVAPPSVKEDLRGIGTFDHWYAEVTSPHKVVQAWLDGKIPFTVVEINQGELNKVAKFYKDKFSVPGAVAKREVRVRGAR